MKLQKYQKCSKVTRGLRKAEFVLKNARIVNVFTREILEGDIAIQDGMIVGIGNYQGEEETDLGGRNMSVRDFIDSSASGIYTCDSGRAGNSGVQAWNDNVYRRST